MAQIYKVATLYINGIANCTRLRMLEDFLWKHDIDIILLQEVTSRNIDAMRRYTKYINIGTEQRGAAMMIKDGRTLTNIRRLPSGRGFAGTYNGTCFANKNAPSWAEKKSVGNMKWIMLWSKLNDLLLPRPAIPQQNSSRFK